MRAEKGNIVIIGAGPAGSIAAALLNNKGYRTVILERDAFPRFSIGEVTIQTPSPLEAILESADRFADDQ